MFHQSADTDERIAESIIQGGINFQKEPWPKVSLTAKDLVKKMLDPNPSTRLTAKEVLGNDSMLCFQFTDKHGAFIIHMQTYWKFATNLFCS